MSCNEIMINSRTEQECPGRYLTHSEMEQFKIDCPICGHTTSMAEFSEHLRDDVARIISKDTS